MSKHAFTVIEMILAVVLLSILAMLALPKFGDASDEARSSALETDLISTRKQIVFYKQQHNGRGPHLNENGTDDEDNMVRRMTEKTTPDGKLDTNGALGPYLPVWPANQFTDDGVARAIVFGNQTTPPRTGESGWYYCRVNSMLSANSTTGAESLDP